MKRKMIGILIFFIMLCTIAPSVQPSNYTKNSTIENEISAPVWRVNDEWDYDASISLSTSDEDIYTSIDISVYPLVLQVESIMNNNYQLAFQGDVNGDFFVKMGFVRLNGKLIDTELNGIIIMNATTFQLKNVTLHLDGRLKVSLVSTDINLDLDISYTPNMELINFPLYEGKEWNTYTVYAEYYGILNIPDIKDIIELLFPGEDEEIPDQIPIEMGSTLEGSDYTCSSIETLNVGGMGKYDCYKIDTTNRTFHYSPVLGTIIDFIPMNSNDDIQFDFNLRSTTYTVPGAPSIPLKPVGENQLESNVEYEYSTSSTDVEQDDIYYFFDWDDGSNSGWIGPYPSGSTINASHSWGKKGSYSIRVKSKDSENHESRWSDPLHVSLPKTKTCSYPIIDWLQDFKLDDYPIIQTFIRFIKYYMNYHLPIH